MRATAARAFEVFTNEIDTCWPATYHIGSSAPKRVVVEGREGGSIYTEQEDGTNSPWAKVLSWEPAHRLVFAWQVSPEFQYEPELAKNSDVEVSFASVADGITEVNLEHRGFDRHGDGHEGVRDGRCGRRMGRIALAFRGEGRWGSIAEISCEFEPIPEIMG